ncbi:hypothetical protein [Sorangium sp. So ce385]|uniref:hypothetical protein n=1 Tax=Sorangium sp. So ce385 TaxID=3133308 RepID=UPI003F5C51BB
MTAQSQLIIMGTTVPREMVEIRMKPMLVLAVTRLGGASFAHEGGPSSPGSLTFTALVSIKPQNSDHEVAVRPPSWGVIPGSALPAFEITAA